MCLTHLSVFKVEVLDEIGVDSADLWHEVERLVEVLLPQALVLDKLQEVVALDETLLKIIIHLTSLSDSNKCTGYPICSRTGFG